MKINELKKKKKKVAESLNCEEESFILLDSRNQEIQDCPATQGNSLPSDICKHPLDVLTHMIPTRMISDNGTTIIASAENVQSLLKNQCVQEYLASPSVKWNGHALLTLDEPTTLLTEVEAVVNDRPITYLTSNHDDLDPLTPAHYLCGRRITTLPCEDVATIQATSGVAATYMEEYND